MDYYYLNYTQVSERIIIYRISGFDTQSIQVLMLCLLW